MSAAPISSAVEVSETPEVESAENNDEEAPAVELVEEASNQVDNALTFTSQGVSFNEKGIAFYNFEGMTPADPAKAVSISKRYSEFKALHLEVSKLMASEKNVPASQTDKFSTYPALPALPKGHAGTLLRGRGNKKLTQERDAQFEKTLNAIARHPIALQSASVAAFLA